LDPLRHPDLARLGRKLRDQLDETLDAEQEAARTVARRKRSLRDILLDAEDRGTAALVSCSDGQLFRGTISAVGTDHVVVATDDTEQVVSMSHIVGVRVG
jgi:hypothetical protein